MLLEFSMFPLDQGDSLSAHVSQLIELIRESGVDYRLTAMGTLVETEQIDTALALVARCNQLLQDRGCQRIYAAIKVDYREGPVGRLQSKVESIQSKIGSVAQ
ncbi:MAG: MTH1187 family thiamine-binding protein [Candidatus Thiodiazotropha sp.]